MTQDQIQVNYAELEKAAAWFGREAEEQRALLTATRQKAAGLRQEWIGRGASAFFAEMDGRILPACSRLVLALEASRDAVQKIAAVFRQAEGESAQFFKDGESGSRSGLGTAATGDPVLPHLNHGRYSYENAPTTLTTPAGTNARIAEMIEKFTSPGHPAALVPLGTGPDGKPAYLVLIRGTQPTGGNVENNWMNNAEAFLTLRTDYQDSIQKMISDHVKPPATIHLAGHSQGGIIACNLARSLDGDISAASIINFGSPRPLLPLPGSVQLQLYRGDMDPIQIVDNALNPHAGVLDPILQQGPDTVKGNFNPARAHFLDSYYHDPEVLSETPGFTLPDRPAEVVHLSNQAPRTGPAVIEGAASEVGRKMVDMIDQVI